MENKGTIFSDSFSVNLIAEIRIEMALKILLILFYTIILGFAVFILSLFKGEGPKSFLLPVIGLGVLLFTSGRYIAWNLFGREMITITTKSIRHYRDYGLIKTASKVIVFNHLATCTTIEKQEDNRMYGVIHFFDRDEATMQEKAIFSSAVNLPIELVKELEEGVHLLQ